MARRTASASVSVLSTRRARLMAPSSTKNDWPGVEPGPGVVPTPTPAQRRLRRFHGTVNLDPTRVCSGPRGVTRVTTAEECVEQPVIGYRRHHGKIGRKLCNELVERDSPPSGLGLEPCLGLRREIDRDRHDSRIRWPVLKRPAPEARAARHCTVLSACARGSARSSSSCSSTGSAHATRRLPR